MDPHNDKDISFFRWFLTSCNKIARTLKTCAQFLKTDNNNNNSNNKYYEKKQREGGQQSESTLEKDTNASATNFNCTVTEDATIATYLWKKTS